MSRQHAILNRITRKSPAVLGTTTGDHRGVSSMRSKPTAVMSRVATVILIVAAASAPCTLPAAAAPAVEPTAVRRTVTEPMTWLVPTQYGYQPAEHVQPTLWLESGPHTRYTVDKPGVERAFVVGR